MSPSDVYRAGHLAGGPVPSPRAEEVNQSPARTGDRPHPDNDESSARYRCRRDEVEAHDELGCVGVSPHAEGKAKLLEGEPVERRTQRVVVLEAVELVFPAEPVLRVRRPQQTHRGEFPVNAAASGAPSGTSDSSTCPNGAGSEDAYRCPYS